MTLLTILRPAETQTGTNYVNENFDAETIGVAPSGWTVEAGAAWTVQNAAGGGLSGRMLSADGDPSVDNFIRKNFTRITGGEVRIRHRWRPPVSTANRGGLMYVYDTTGSHVVALGPLEGGTWSYSNSSGLSGTAGSWVALAVYDVVLYLDLDNNKFKFTVNGTLYDNAGAWWSLSAGTAGIDRLKISAYAAGAVSHWHDDISVATLVPPVAPPTATGTLSQSGTFDSVALGADRWGQITLGYANSDALITTVRTERSSDNTNWADISDFTLVNQTASGRWTVTDPRPQYGSQAVTFGAPVYYRLAGANSGGATPTSASTALTSYLDQGATELARFSVLSSYMAGAAVISQPWEPYPAYWLAAMSYAYAKTGIAQYLTDAQNQFTYIQTLDAGASGIVQLEDYQDALYRDHHWRHVLYAAACSRLMRRIGQTTFADTLITQADTWALAFYALNTNAPLSSTTRHGWDYDNSSTAGAQLAWTASTAYSVGDIVRPTVSNTRTYRVTVAGNSGGTQPTWPTTDGATVALNGVTYQDTAQTGAISYPTYDPVSPFAPIDPAVMVDANQSLEEAASVALLLTDPSSGFFTAGANRTKALTHLLDTTNLLSTYQTSTGAVPIGDTYPAVNGPETYDVLYGGYALLLMALCVRYAPALINPWMETMARKGMTGWLNASYATEPLTTLAYTGRTDVSFDELVVREYPAAVLQLPNPVGHLRYTTATQVPSLEMQGNYNPHGFVTPFGLPDMARMFQTDVLLELWRLDSPRPAVMAPMIAA